MFDKKSWEETVVEESAHGPLLSKTRENAKWFGEAQKIAAQVYHELLTSQHDQHKIWYPLRNKAQQMIRQGMTREAIIGQLRNEFVVPQKKEKQ